jgi:hypothetical protein
VCANGEYNEGQIISTREKLVLITLKGERGL